MTPPSPITPQAVAALPDLLRALALALATLEHLTDAPGAYRWTAIDEARKALGKAGVDDSKNTKL